jgi:hypothetical protein
MREQLWQTDESVIDTVVRQNAATQLPGPRGGRTTSWNKAVVAPRHVVRPGAWRPPRVRGRGRGSARSGRQAETAKGHVKHSCLHGRARRYARHRGVHPATVFCAAGASYHAPHLNRQLGSTSDAYNTNCHY